MFATRIGRWRDDLLPRTHMMAERRVAKDSRHLSQPIKVRIWLLLFPGNHVCESFIESCRFTSHTSCGGEDDRCEDTTFYVSDTLTILPFLQQFVFPVGRRDVRGTITGCVWVENPNVEKCIQ